jgi:hypothetical protein
MTEGEKPPEPGEVGQPQREAHENASPEEILANQIPVLLNPGEGEEKPPIDPKSPAGRILIPIQLRLKTGVPVTQRFIEELLDELDILIGKGEIAPEEYALVGGVLAEAYLAATTPEPMGAVATTLDKVANAMKETATREVSTYEVFVNAEFLQQPIALQLDTFPPEWFKRLSPEEQHLVRVRLRLANAAAVKRRWGDIDGEKTKGNEFLSLTQREFSLLYNMPGARWAMEQYAHQLFSPRRENGNYFLEIKPNPNPEDSSKKYDPTILEQLLSFQEFQERLIKEMLVKKIVESPADARAAAAAAWNFLFVGNIVESADIQREVNPSGVFGEQLRAFMHPLAKAISKYKAHIPTPVGTEEGWGGKVGIWIASRITKDPNFKQRLTLQRGTESFPDRIKPFPERMFASLPEIIEVETEKGKMSMAQALYEKKRILTQKTDSDIFGQYNDVWDSAWKVYYYATGKVPLEWPKIGEWANPLADAKAKLNGNDLLRPYYQDPEMMLWIIANSIGLLTSSSELLLTPPVDDDAYDVVVSQIVEFPRLMSNKKQRTWIKKCLHAQGFFRGKGKRAKIRWHASHETSS